MRAFFITLVLLAAIGAGVYNYWKQNPEAFAAKSETPAPAPEIRRAQRPRAELCSVRDARYQHRVNSGVTLRIAASPEGFAARGDGASGYENIGAAQFVVAGGGREFRFAAGAARGDGATFLFPTMSETETAIPAGGDLIQLSAFDGQLNYVAGLPRLDQIAPAHLYAPGLSRWFAANSGEPKLELPIAFFDFVSCAPPPVPAQAGEAAPASTP